jgi:hypothetical protein
LDIDDLLKYISPIIVGFLAAYFGSVLALRKFKREKVWDERRAAYKDVIESFEELIHWSEQVRASHCCEPTIGGEAKFDESLRKISKFSATGSLIFSKKFQEILEQANKNISRVRFKIDEESKPDQYTEAGSSEWYFFLANEIRNIVEDCLPKLIDIAKSEAP